MSEIDKLAGRIYTAFITRDITYVASGGMVIAVALAPLDVVNLAMLDSWAVVLAYAVCSYVLGLLLQVAATYLGLIRTVPTGRRTEHRSYDWMQECNHTVLMDEIHKHCHPNTVLQIERTVFLKTFAATIGSALLTIGVIMSVYTILGILVWTWWQLLLLELAILLFFLVCRGLNASQTRLQFETIRQLNEKIKESKTEDEALVAEGE